MFRSTSARHSRRGSDIGGRFWKPAVASLTALVGLALVTLGPAAVALLWQDRSQSQAQERAGQHYLGMPVRDGPITFVIHEVRCGPDSEATHGQRCEVTIGVRNDGAEETTVPGSAQRLRVAEEAWHQPVNIDKELFGALAPGKTATAVLGFDLPRHVTATHVEVHSDTYSRGQPIDVGGPPLPLLD